MVYSNTMLSRHLATLYLSLAPIIRNARKILLFRFENTEKNNINLSVI